MGQKGKHTWDIHITYHRCPSCGYIFEDRGVYEYILGKYIKNLECTRCGKTYTIESSSSPTLGPFFGEPSAPEVEWRD